MFIKLQILLASPMISLYWWEVLRLDAVITPRSWTHCMLLSLMPFISYSKFGFLYLLEIKLFSPTLMSFIYIVNRTSLGTESCGTPLVTGAQSVAMPLITTLLSSIV